MNRFIWFLFLVVFFVSLGSGEVFYEIDADEDVVMVNTTLEVSCDASKSSCPVNRWNLSWNIPSDSEIVSISDSFGGIEEYSRKGNALSIITNPGDRRSSETVKIEYKISRGAEEIHRGLFKRNFNLPGFKGDRTSGVVKNPDLISGWMGRGFDTSYDEGNMSFTGTGSGSVRINFGEGDETKYYTFFGGNPDNTSLAYEVSVGMTGLVQGFDRFPVALMSPEEYDGSVVGWSSGEYVGGSFRMRDNLEDNFLPVLAHETVHGLNERELKWDSSSSTWFDEGTAKYVESMLNLHLQGKEKTRKLFGGNTTYTESRNGDLYRVTSPSAGNPKRLWRYYQNDQDFMKNWNPNEFPNERSFGYAYSELVIRNYVARENGSLRKLYGKVRPRNEISSNEEKWNHISQEIDLTPCKYEARSRFDECLEKINQYDYSIFRAENVTISDQNVLKSINIKEREDEKAQKDLKPDLDVREDKFSRERVDSRSKIVLWLENLLGFFGF